MKITVNMLLPCTLYCHVRPDWSIRTVCKILITDIKFVLFGDVVALLRESYTFVLSSDVLIYFLYLSNRAYVSWARYIVLFPLLCVLAPPSLLTVLRVVYANGRLILQAKPWFRSFIRIAIVTMSFMLKSTEVYAVSIYFTNYVRGEYLKQDRPFPSCHMLHVPLSQNESQRKTFHMKMIWWTHFHINDPSCSVRETKGKWRVQIDHYFKEMKLSHLVNINFPIDFQNGLEMWQHYYAR